MKFVMTQSICPEGIEKLKADTNGQVEIIAEDNPDPNNYLDDMKDADALIVRIAKCDAHAIENSPNLKVIGRTGVGYDSVDVKKATELGIPVVITPGANNRSVAEHAVAMMFALSKNLYEGQVETRKGNWEIRGAHKAFELEGKTVGVIGLGAIGVQVANAALDLGMEVIGYDPFLSLESAWHLSPNVVHEESMEELVAKADYITLHIPLNDKTRNTFDEKLFAATKPGARLLNFARGGLVDNAALKKAIADGIIARYMTDFPSEDLLGDPANIIVTPHLGASTPESEENCAIMAAQEIREYLTHGNIKNSVNFPNCVVPYNGKPRITVCHQNIVNMIGQLGAVFTKYSVNIDKLVNNSKGDLAYNIVVCDNLPENIDDMIKDLYAINTVLKVRILD